MLPLWNSAWKGAVVTTSDNNKIRCPECYSEGYATEPDGGVSCTSCDCRYYPSLQDGDDASETHSESPGSTPLTDAFLETIDDSCSDFRAYCKVRDHARALERRCRSLEAALREAGNWLSGIAEDLDGSGCEIEAKQMRKGIEDLIKPLAQGSGGGGHD